MIRPEIVVPLFDEEGNVPALVDALCAKGIADVADFIIVNNGSTDRTWAKLEECMPTSASHIRLVNIPENLGYGGGILEGLAHTERDYVGWTHGDLQTPVSDVQLAVHRLREGEKSIVKGFRVGRPVIDRVTSRLMSTLLLVVLGARFLDINAQPTIIHRSLLDTPLTMFKGFDFDLAAVFFAKLHGHVPKRFTVRFPNRLAGKSAWNVGAFARLRLSIKMCQSMFTLRKFMA